MTSYFRTWAAYRKGFILARNIEIIAEEFPPKEKYKLTDQITRSSRSVCSCLGESFAKRRYPKHFISKISDASGENYETQVWLDFAIDREYIDKKTYQKLIKDSEEVGKLLSYMEFHPEHYATRKRK
ncbi:four helix bundle protein [Neolewinella agarilytica]|uniref:Four helix bundle protein n=1 Tax=Neolewinella agarilytica TaxID=478744 RepID=A0A1H9MNY4_9BACT|nr:four helix bundle protein [Neolewinella agarilytica]SER25187.1 four helix bundle protein [Neolewinella agarilytica]